MHQTLHPATGARRRLRGGGGAARHRHPGDPSAPWTGAIVVHGRRHAWVDAGRGVAIVLVVLVHATLWLHTSGVDVGPWRTINEVLVGMRMPLFFTLSGMLGAGWLARSWSHVASAKVGFLAWVYLIWQPIGLLAALMADQFTGHRQTLGHFLLALAGSTVRPRSELWFLWALALFFALTWLTRRVPVRGQLAVAAVSSAVALAGLLPLHPGWIGVPTFYAFFLFGLHHRDLLLWAADRAAAAPPAVGVAVVAGWLGIATATVLLDAERYLGLAFATRLTGLAAGVTLAVMFARSRLLRYLGSRTLPIYLAHTPVLLALAWAAHVQRHEPVVARTGLLLPLVATTVAIAVSLGLHAALRLTPARLLYEPPEAVTSMLRRFSSPGTKGTRPVGRSNAEVADGPFRRPSQSRVGATS